MIYEESDMKMKKQVGKYDSFKPVEELILKLEQGNELRICLMENEVRIFKIEFYLDGFPLRPYRFTGKIKALQSWTKLIAKLYKNKS